MRIAFFDGLLENHVPASLERALTKRGHLVFNTGKIGHGFTFETRPDRIFRIENNIDEVLSFDPDVVFVFRPASLPPAQLRRLKLSGAKLAVWLSDDPVLWNLSYRPVIDQYDLVLNCGSGKVLNFYDNYFGRAVGVNMPFWTDSESFPYVFGKHRVESSAMFLGNVQDEVRRRRYFALSDLDLDVRIHGNTGIDFNNLSAGYLDSDQEVVDAASRSYLAINIPQYFRDHSGLPTWFDGLGELGTFQYPSRVIQYAAMGLPIISVTPEPEIYDTFPELQIATDFSDIDAHASRLLADVGELEKLSIDTHRRFERHFSAESRAMMLEDLVENDSWRKSSLHERARWFSRYDGTSPMSACTEDPDTLSARETIRLSDSDDVGVGGNIIEVNDTLSPEFESRDSKQIVVIGEGWTRASSPISTAYRALIALGDDPIKVTPLSHSSVFVKDPSREFKSFIDVTRLLDRESFDALLIFGTNYIVSKSGIAALNKRGIPLVVCGIPNRTLNIVNSKLVTRANVVCVTHPELYNSITSAGFNNAVMYRPLVDSEFVAAARAAGIKSNTVRTIGARRADLANFKHLRQDLIDLQSEEMYVEELSSPPATVDQLLEYVSSSVLVIAPDSALPGIQASDYIGFGMAAGAIVVSPRVPGSMLGGEPGRTHITSRDRYELLRKISRISEDRNEFERYIGSAVDYVSSEGSAETYYTAVLNKAHRSLGSDATVPNGLTIDTPFPPSGVLSREVFRTSESGLHSARFTVAFDFAPPWAHEMLQRVGLRITLGGKCVAEANLLDLIGSHSLSIGVPSRYSRSQIEVQLCSGSPLPFFNWPQFVHVKTSFEQRSLPAALSQIELSATSLAFVKTI